MGKVKQVMTLTAAQVATAKKLGFRIEDYAKLIQTAPPVVTMTEFNPNEDPVYTIPLSELVNLWRARYGDTWVDVSDIDEEFWSDASARLHTNKKMEELNHHTTNTPWARLKEDA